MNIYAVDPIEIKRIHTKQFPLSVFSMMDEWLSQRLELGPSYEIPVMSALEEYNPEDYDKIKSVNLKFQTGL